MFIHSHWKLDEKLFLLTSAFIVDTESFDSLFSCSISLWRSFFSLSMLSEIWFSFRSKTLAFSSAEATEDSAFMRRFVPLFSCEDSFHCGALSKIQNWGKTLSFHIPDSNKSLHQIFQQIKITKSNKFTEMQHMIKINHQLLKRERGEGKERERS